MGSGLARPTGVNNYGDPIIPCITNKTITYADNTLTGVAGVTATQTLTNKTIVENVSVISTNTNAVASGVYVLTADLTLTLPGSPSTGNWVRVSNLSAVLTCIIARNGNNIMALGEDLTVDIANAGFTLEYSGATQGWVIL